MRPYLVVDSKSQVLGRFEVCMDTIEVEGRQYPYSYTKVHDSVCILPILKNSQGEEQVVLIRQYRHAIDQWILEAAAGGIEKGETKEMAAIREAYEETGCRIAEEQLIDLGAMYPLSGTTNEKMYLFAAVCERMDNPKSEPTEFIERKVFSSADFQDMIKDGTFQNMYGIAAWYKYQLIKERN